jgi:hypothetical protein
LKDTAKVLDVGVVKTAFGFFAQNQHGDFSSGGVDGGLQPRRPGAQDDDIETSG